MTPLRTLMSFVLVATICLSIDQPGARGYSWFEYGGSVVTWYPPESLRYLSSTTFPPESDTDILYRTAMGVWGLVPSSTFAYSYAYLDEELPIDHYDGYNDTAAVSASELDPGVLGVTYMVNDGAQWFDMDMLFSASAAGNGWNFDENPGCDVVRNPAESGVSFRLVATHELGHALGLGHEPTGTLPPGTPWFVATMNASYPAGGPIGAEAIVELHADDRNGVRFLYPHSGPSETVVDVANPGYTWSDVTGKAVPAFITPAVAYPGDIITLRCVIENFGNTNEFNVRQGFYLSEDETVDTSDTSLGDLRWDIAMGDGFDFDVDADLPADLPAGEYTVGSILDDLDEIDEAYEDNNLHVYCDPLMIAQLPPAISELGQDTASCSAPYVGPTPTVSHPLNMAPLTWSIDNPQPGMTIDSQTGVLSWPEPVRSAFPYTVIVRATNDAGSDTKILFLGVEQGLPMIEPIGVQSAPHTQPYVGPAPVLTSPSCMNPILNWSIDSAPAGMTIDHATGVVTWDRPRYSALPYAVQIRATNAIGNGTWSWSLHVTGLVGDLNCDGAITFADINPFVAALSGEATYFAEYPDCEPRLGDCNGDGVVGFADINAFVALLSGS